MYRLLVVVILLAACPFTHATISQSGAGKQNAEFDVMKNGFAEQRQKIIVQLADGETYNEISDENRTLIRDALDRIDGQLKSAGSVEALSADQKAAVFNDQELVNNLLTKARADSRLVCTREKTVRSRLATTQCMTVAARNRARESAQDALRNVKVPTLEQK